MRREELTGTNNIPVASNRRFGRVNPESTSLPLQESRNTNNADVKLISVELEDRRGRPSSRPDVVEPKKRKRGNRWGDAAENNQVADLVGLPTAIFAKLSPEQLDAYTMHVRIMEITQKLKIGDIIPIERLRYLTPISF